MSIDTRVPGEHSEVRAAAEWLDPTASDAVDDASGDMRNLFGYSGGHWISTSGDAYRSTLSLAMSAADDVEGLMKDVAEKLRSYAGQLERLEGYIADHRDAASSAGLTLTPTTIEPPTSTLPYCPTDRDDPLWDDWQDHLDRVELFNEIAEDVGTRWGDLETWVQDNLTAFIVDVPTTPASELLGFLADQDTTVATTYLDYNERQWQTNVIELQDRSATMAEDAAEFKRQLRSGNPAVRAAAAAAGPTGLRIEARELSEAAEALRRAGRVLPIAGTALDVVLAGSQIAAGESPSSVGVEFLGGVAGGAAAVGIIALAGVTLPVWGTALVVGGAAVAVGAGAKWAYEGLVPQDVRESIDAGIADAWDATTDFAEDAWDNTVGAAWDWAFG
ncbi:hypothetical protein [Litorihabitans aurantiacus]|uniref:Uncharacterized protein n=1 Tax=Litorihabitans aurantiacus TaxID=1930061 RepID=A0AA37XGY9_9MICO|nr:hypothetical protein [Litorihabitans aurantiacus]GMA33316.1 hypothetical protein GCM10025875_33080 [Litorihabitans aurantiacus]